MPHFELRRLRERWQEHAQRLLLVTGLALVVAGIVFFFAYNWQSLHRLLKLGLIELAFVLCLTLAHLRWRQALVVDALRTCAGFLVGVLLAVYGQQYQTGADAYELFVSWAILILPLVVLARVAALWVLWLAVVHTGSILWWQQVAGSEGLIDYPLLCVALAGLVAGALVIRELLVPRGWLWLAGHWLRWLLIASVLTTLLVPVTEGLFEGRFDQADYLGSLAGLLVSLGALFFFYRLRLPDITVLALGMLGSTYFVVILLAKLIFDIADLETEGGFLLMGLGTLGIFTAAAFGLRAMHRSIEKDAPQAGEPVEHAPEVVERRSTEPWYLHLLAGLGAWVSAIFFVGFLVISEAYDFEPHAAIVGAVILAGAIVLSWNIGGTFGGQAVAALGLVGNAGLLIGIGSVEHGVRTLPLLFWGQLVIAAAAYPLLRSEVYRFVSWLLVPVFAAIWFYEQEWLFAFHYLIAGELLLAAALWLPARVPEALRTLRLAALTLLPGTLLFFEFTPLKRGFGSYAQGQGWLVSGLIAAFAISLIVRLGGRTWMRRRAVWIGLIATLALAGFSAQGLMIALLLFLLAFTRQHGYALALALLFLPCFFVSYYYSLNVDLRYKSWVVAGTGVLLLVLRPFLCECEEAV